MRNRLFAALLSHLSPGEEGIPLKVSVVVTPSDEVHALRADLAEVRRDRDELKKTLQRCEFLLECNHHVHAQLMDHCRANGLAIPRNVRNYDRERQYKIIYE